MDGIMGRDISYSYEGEGGDAPALSQVELSIPRGSFVAILGHNGCGKSTLVRLLNALLPLQEGALQVGGIPVDDPPRRRALRRSCGMVFQNPENQFVSSLVEEEVAFGLKNYDWPPAEIPGQVAAALALVGLSGYEKRAPNSLSGGEKQRLALAGVLAMEPEFIVFDEATSMLDPEGRWALLNTMEALHRKGKTIVMITHYVEEAVAADRVYLMQAGRILAAGSPREILTDRALLEQAGLLPPMAAELYYDLAEAGLLSGPCPLTKEELVEALCR
ncbi:MAG: ATP-binding cassette domain-containing protein [Pseudoflavonifractor sp.]